MILAPELSYVFQEEFGPSDHLYNCDTFNEMVPTTNDTGSGNSK